MDGDKSWLALQHRVCVVTGAASGIGASIAERLAQVGARVVLLDRDTQGLQRMHERLQGQGADSMALSCDISDAASVQDAADKVHATWGASDALINNAGLLRAGGLLSLIHI